VRLQPHEEDQLIQSAFSPGPSLKFPDRLCQHPQAALIVRPQSSDKASRKAPVSQREPIVFGFRLKKPALPQQELQLL
jgi:hypothetical protein